MVIFYYYLFLNGFSILVVSRLLRFATLYSKEGFGAQLRVHFRLHCMFPNQKSERKGVSICLPSSFSVFYVSATPRAIRQTDAASRGVQLRRTPRLYNSTTPLKRNSCRSSQGSKCEEVMAARIDVSEFLVCPNG